ncbi:tRNA pseudouridine synthase B [Candidatus Photodesmus katoptron]|uniref:tRNA pseudouridine(55) synthase TruB n=1 Tax=Candidatus Photodesmus anomalopis TaxID=28176 RepID=UPI0004D8227B|nr:tRNA pseudouridine(55) synthase TruB [Candidatus Photodesmus katoptron]KEY90446.1 tRNA pseudouridine synthase B [Candidatus Photodesmus katoptron]
MIENYLNSRSVNGIILLDKPMNISSNHALQQVKRLYCAKKAGHSGTLDPLATGMLPICFGEATKFSQFLLNSDKCYIAKIKLGERTDTSDSNGKIIETRDINVTRKQLDHSLKKFTGEILQIPSMFSALKYKGYPLYKYARNGVEIPRKARKITVYYIKLLYFKKDELEIEIHSSKGTYIRTIVNDLGEILGCGAHITQLRRIGFANYLYHQMITLDELNELVKQAQKKKLPNETFLDSLLMPMDTAIRHLPKINIDEKLVKLICNGIKIKLPEEEISAQGFVRIITKETKIFIGVAMIDKSGTVIPKRLISS